MRQKILTKALKELLTKLNEHKLTTDEVVVLTGNFVYSVGAAIANRTKDPPTLEELETSYMMKPMIDNFLMLTGINIAARIPSEIEKEKKTNDN